jgi:DNA invertase Pin-like site-specific DNA recombinase
MKRNSSSPKEELIPAAQYVRMSTEHQQYSIDNQSQAINLYASANQMKIVRTYTDAGKSGLTAENRPGLRQLIHEVESGSAGYSVVLVYDVSRWGRFQDADESAYYEYRCRRAHIAVHYCTETFANDGTVSAALLKAIKRAMAAEYSRELSAKVFAGRARLTELGFRQGGLAGYGLRRLLVDQHGNSKGALQSGERKSIATDRVILIPGPANEIEIVREVFRLYAVDRLSTVEIAKGLNDRGVPWQGDRAWTRSIICNMVMNPKYIGANVSNRLSGKLRTRRVHNPPHMWIRRDHAFEAIVDPELFRQAEAVAASRLGFYTDEALLQHLRDFLARHGHLTEREISADPDMPCSEVYQARFGGLLEAYRRIGYQPLKNYSYVERNRKVLPMRRAFSAAVIDALTKLGVSVRSDVSTKLLIANERFTIRLSVALCHPAGRPNRWILRLHSPLKPHITLIARLTPGDEKFLDYFCFPRGTHSLRQLTVAPVNPMTVDRHRFRNLASLLEDVFKGQPKENSARTDPG